MPVFNRRLRSALLAGTALTLAAVIAPTLAHAATAIYDGAGATTSTGNYNLGTNYDTGVAPSSTSDTAVFNDTATVAKTTTITFATATNPLGTLSFTNTTPYTFTLTTGQSFNPNNLTSSSTGTQTFNLAGTGAMTIGALSNSAAGGETFATTGTGVVAITGAAAIGTSTLTYTGNNAAVGGAFTSAGGTLNISGVTNGAASTLGSLAGSGAVTLGANTLSTGVLGSTTTYSGVISGTNGNLTVTGGNLTLSGTNTYTGATTLTNATLTAGVANTIATSTSLTMTSSTFALNGFNETVNNLASGAASTITLGANALTVGGANSTTFGGIISGTGTLTYAGTGILSLTNTNTYTGATTINTGGTINGTTTSIASTSNVVDNGTLQFTNSGAGTYTKVISGTGAVQILGGTVTLSGANTFGGNLLVGGGGTLAGAVTAEDLGTSITFNAGTIQAGGALTTANAVALTGNGTIDSNGNAVGLTGAITGAGSLTKIGTGNLTLSNAGDTYSGGTSITAGTVTIAANNAAGSGALAVGTGTTFVMNGFNQSVADLTGAGAITSSGGALTSTGTGTYTGSITSTGTLTKSTSGLQVLDGASSFTSTTISGGSLQVGDAANTGATLTGPVSVQSGGTLLGHGSIIGNVISAGTVQPGGTIGTLTVNGNYQSTSASTLAIELNPVTSSQLAVSGGAGLAGTLAVMPDAGVYTTGMQYTILTAGGGVSGRFAAETDTSNSVIFATSYFPNSVVLTAVNLNQGFVNQTQNEMNFAGAVRSIVSNPATGANVVSGLAGILGTAQVGQSGPQVAGTLGELRADSATIVLSNSSAFQNTLIERMNEREGLTTTHTANNGLPGTFDVAMNDSDMPLFGPSGMLTIDQPSVWMHGYGVLSEFGGESGYADFQSRTGGIVAGIDSMINPGALIGVALAYEHTDYNLSGDTDENNIDTYRASLYGSSKLDPVPLTIDAAFGYAFNDYHNNSFLQAFNGNGFTQTSRHDGNTLTAETGLSHAFAVPQNVTAGKLTLVPRVGIEYDNIQQNDFTTTGAPVSALNLHTEGSTLNALRSTIGGKADLDLKTDNGTIVTPEVRAAYLHDYMDTNVALTENFTGVAGPGAGFSIQGVRPGRDAALVGTGVTVGFNKNISASLTYDADVRDHEMDNIIQAGVKYTW